MEKGARLNPQMPKRYTPDISKEVKHTVIEGSAFDAAMQKLLQASPMPKTEISRRLKTRAAVSRLPRKTPQGSR